MQTSNTQEKYLPLQSHHVPAFVSDASPDRKLSIGKRVKISLDGKLLFGTVTEVFHKNVSIKLEKKWMKRNSITMNWAEVRIAGDHEKDSNEGKREIEIEKRKQNISRVKNAISSIDALLSNQHQSDSLSPEVRDFNCMLEEFFDDLQRLNDLKKQLHEKSKMLLEIRKQYIETGIDSSMFSEIPDVESKGFHSINYERTRQIRAKKRELQIIRDFTRKILVGVLLASGENGMESRDIIQTIAEMKLDSSSDNEMLTKITPHRIMGMLSSLSRKKESELIEHNRWRATASLTL